MSGFTPKLAGLILTTASAFADHYDPHNTHHGLLLVSNDDVVKPNTGFRTHPHHDMEIITWVLDGELEHKDSEGNTGILYPGLAQRMSAGTGIWHSEMNPQTDKDVHFIQMWVPPDTEHINPSYEQLDINRELERGETDPHCLGAWSWCCDLHQAAGCRALGWATQAEGIGTGSRCSICASLHH